MTHQEFLAIKDKLTAALAEGIKVKLTEMGDRAKGISWFSSKAADYASESR